ncbi:MAG: DUF2490 domain-containing protein [Bacteroidota bacterium]
MRHILSILIVFIPVILSAQKTEFSSGLLSSITFSTSITDNLQITAKAESMQEMLSNRSTIEVPYAYSYLKTDLQGFVSYRFNPFWSAAAGYQYRLINGDDNAHRAIQQLALVQRRTAYRLGHRFRTDQTFRDSESTEYRFRYRLSAEFSLQGQEVDPREFYLLISDEPIFSLQDDEQDIENRFSVNIGYYFSSRHRLEAGPDYRVDKLLSGGNRHRIWINLGWKIKI